MWNLVWRVAFWGLAYLIAALLPLGIAICGDVPAGRGFLMELGVALGIVGYAMLGLQFLSTSRFHWIAPFFGSDAEIQFHRETGILSLAFILAHPLLLIVSDSRYLSYFSPWENLPRAMALSLALVAMVLLVVLPLWRISFRLSYEWWRLTHGLLAAFVILVGLAHALQVGHYVSGVWKQAFWLGGAGVALLLLCGTRLVKPWRVRKFPWRVKEVRGVCPEVQTLVLEPVGHPGMSFRAGQYAWLTLGETPFTLQQHPFSFSSSAKVLGEVEFAIKEAGDFTSTIPHVEPGTQAYLEGPYGSFVLEDSVAAAVFVVGGIGITPILSILRTCRDQRDTRPFLLIYANSNFETIAFHDELEQLRQDLRLEIVHVLDSPPDDWQGEAGYIDAELLRRHIPDVTDLDRHYFICGPPPLMDAVELALADRGVPHRRLISERFDLV